MSFYCNLTATGIDSIDRIYKITPATPVYGGPETHYTHIYGLDNFHSNFESVGCAFESHRGCHLISRLYVSTEGVIFESR